MPPRRPAPRSVTAPRPSSPGGKIGAPRSLSQRVRSVSLKKAMDEASRDLRSRNTFGGRKISTKDVLDRYNGDRTKTDPAPKTGKRPGSSSPAPAPWLPAPDAA